ncbi:hypothetical protein GF367_04510 [Candidatus Woesearchaeota archaeon]|nr:hypothetical protein [Candidatus Woesearchaeota archaeon]
MLLNLFGKKNRFVHDHGQFSGWVIFNSQFIYDFVSDYLSYGSYKTKTVQLKKSVSEYSKEFLEGFFLGLMLSDGHLGDKFSYQTISEDLARNFLDLMRYFGFKPYLSTAKRAKYGWNDLHCIFLNRKHIGRAEAILCAILSKTFYDKTFRELKGIFR